MLHVHVYRVHDSCQLDSTWLTELPGSLVGRVHIQINVYTCTVQHCSAPDVCLHSLVCVFLGTCVHVYKCYACIHVHKYILQRVLPSL